MATPQARAGILRGALALLTLLPGWVLNLGYRWEVATRLYQGQDPTFPPFRWSRYVLRRGLVVWGVIALSLSPGAALALAGGGAWWAGLRGLALSLWWLAGGLLLAAVLLVPAGMTRLGCEGDRTVLHAPWRLWRTIRPQWRAYSAAWCITAGAIALSLGAPTLLGLARWPWLWGPSFWQVSALGALDILAFGLNLALFFMLSVWAWQVAGYAFTVALYGGRAQAGAGLEGDGNGRI
ncbi:hypothetical protein [Deinococcus aquaedulcis]|uniref:hypothetical protein n=1 Tax=Deinococcus aquaedulcis TaxID=2840455 RepID=UPI001C83054F|nr:hypothetical protein [Deinococcus aquaedulcis]